jgi:hypothetical protein
MREFEPLVGASCDCATRKYALPTALASLALAPIGLSQLSGPPRFVPDGPVRFQKPDRGPRA